MVHDHMDAINRRDTEGIASTSAFPLIQMWPDGSKTVMETARDMPTGGIASNWKYTHIDQLDLVETSGDLIVYRLTFTRYDTSDQPTLGTHRALWAVSREGEEWKVGWRQYLGEVSHHRQ